MRPAGGGPGGVERYKLTHRRAPAQRGRGQNSGSRRATRRSPPAHVLAKLSLRPSDMVQPELYATGEELRVLVGLRQAARAEIGELRAELRSQGTAISFCSTAILAITYAFGRVGVQLSVPQWMEVLGYEERQVQRAFAELKDAGLLLRVPRLISVVELGLRDEATGQLYDGFKDGRGRIHREVQLPSVVYVTAEGREVLEARPAAVGPSRGAQDGLIPFLLRALGPALRVMHLRRAARSYKKGTPRWCGRRPPDGACGQRAWSCRGRRGRRLQHCECFRERSYEADFFEEGDPGAESANGKEMHEPALRGGGLICGMAFPCNASHLKAA